jgi:hypothetical protein
LPRFGTFFLAQLKIKVSIKMQRETILITQFHAHLDTAESEQCCKIYLSQFVSTAETEREENEKERRNRKSESNEWNGSWAVWKEMNPWQMNLSHLQRNHLFLSTIKSLWISASFTRFKVTFFLFLPKGRKESRFQLNEFFSVKEMRKTSTRSHYKGGCS